MRHALFTLIAATAAVAATPSPAGHDVARHPSADLATVVETQRVEGQRHPRPRKEQDPLTRSGPMEFTHVRSNDPGCDSPAARTASAPRCFEWIAADGTIDQSSPHRLKRALARLKGAKLAVFVNSPGGSVDDAIEMARIIRQHGLDVVVARTELISCGPRDTACNELKARSIRLGAPASLARCASSCPFVLAGGVRRLVGPGAYVGLHRAATFRVLTQVMRTYRTVPRYELGIPVGTTRKLVSEKPVGQKVEQVETKRETYDKIEENFISMGVSKAIMAPMLATPNSDMRWLTAAEIAHFRLATDAISGQQFATLKRLPPVRPSPAVPGNGIEVGLSEPRTVIERGPKIETGTLGPPRPTPTAGTPLQQKPATAASAVPATAAAPHQVSPIVPVNPVPSLGLDDAFSFSTMPLSGFAPGAEQ